MQITDQLCNANIEDQSVKLLFFHLKIIFKIHVYTFWSSVFAVINSNHYRNKLERLTLENLTWNIKPLNKGITCSNFWLLTFENLTSINLSTNSLFHNILVHLF